MKNVHLVIADLFLPEDISACADLYLPALEKMLARGTWGGVDDLSPGSARTLEEMLCSLFAAPAGMGIAPLSAAFDGLGEGCWMRADPVHLRLQRDQLLLLPDVELDAKDSGILCKALNEHFVGQGMEFFAPHPQRWYMRVERLPDIEAAPLHQVAGRNVRDILPAGNDAVRWHGFINEIQMLLFAHPVNTVRDVQGRLTVNSLWFWGGGCSGSQMPKKTCDHVSSDDVLPEIFAFAADIPFSSWQSQWRHGGISAVHDRQLLVWTELRSALQRGDLNAWRTALQDFETAYAQPLWQALRAGKIAQLRVSVQGGAGIRHLLLNRADSWAFWRRTRPLAQYSMV